MKASEIIIGTPVIYWAVIGKNGEHSNPKKTEITSEVWDLGGEPVCKVKDIAGGVAISHLVPVSPASLLAAMLQGGDKIVTEAEFLAESEKFFADRGVTAVFNQPKSEAVTDPAKELTWRDLKSFIDTLSNEQLGATLRWWGDDRGGTVKKLSLADDNYYVGDYELEAESTLSAEEKENYHLVIRKGDPMLDVDSVSDSSTVN